MVKTRPVRIDILKSRETSGCLTFKFRQKLPLHPSLFNTIILLHNTCLRLNLPKVNYVIQDKLGKTHTMPVKDKEKDLDIIIDDKLKFHLQTKTAANKANGVLSLIHQSFKYFSRKTLT